MDKKLLHTVEALNNEIDLAYPFAHQKDYVIFGSASLAMRGILDREPGDIDVFMTRKLWGRLLANEDWIVETPKATHPPILSNKTLPITVNAFFDWSNEFADMDAAHLIANKEWIWYNYWVYPVVSVQEALRVKEAAAYLGGHAKHLPDIEVIKEWISKTH